MTTVRDDGKRVFWHRELPPLSAELVGEHTVEADSGPVPGAVMHGDVIWSRCYGDLVARTETRLVQEIARLGGDYAHVHDEAIESRRNEATGESWLHGRFGYVLYRRPSASPPAAAGQ